MAFGTCPRIKVQLPMGAPKGAVEKPKEMVYIYMGTLSLIIDFLSTVFLVRIQVVSVCDCGLDIYYMSNVFSSLNTPPFTQKKTIKKDERNCWPEIGTDLYFLPTRLPNLNRDWNIAMKLKIHPWVVPLEFSLRKVVKKCHRTSLWRCHYSLIHLNSPFFRRTRKIFVQNSWTTGQIMPNPDVQIPFWNINTWVGLPVTELVLKDHDFDVPEIGIL